MRHTLFARFYIAKRARATVWSCHFGRFGISSPFLVQQHRDFARNANLAENEDGRRGEQDDDSSGKRKRKMNGGTDESGGKRRQTEGSDGYGKQRGTKGWMAVAAENGDGQRGERTGGGDRRQRAAANDWRHESGIARVSQRRRARGPNDTRRPSPAHAQSGAPPACPLRTRRPNSACVW